MQFLGVFVLNIFSPSFSPCRYSEQCSPDAPCSSRSEWHSYGRQYWWNDSLHAGSQLHYRPHLSGIGLCSLRCHGMTHVCISTVCFGTQLGPSTEISALKYCRLEFSYMLTERVRMLTSINTRNWKRHKSKKNMLLEVRL